MARITMERASTTGPCQRWPEDSSFIREVLDRIGDKWSVLVIGTLQAGPLRYSDLHSVVPGISQRMLTLTLQQLARDGLVTRTAYPQVPPRVEYELTALGESLMTAVTLLSSWAADNHATVASNRAAFDEATHPQASGVTPNPS